MSQSLSSRAEAATGPGSQWEAFYPTAAGLWTVVAYDRTGATVFLAYDPADNTFRIAPPESDPLLGHLSTWLAKGSLISYRVGVKATVRIEHQEGPVYAKVFTRFKFNQMLDRLAVVDEASRQAPTGFPRFANAQPVNSRVILFDSLGGTSLADVLRGGSASVEVALEAAGRSLAKFHSVVRPARDPQPSERSALEYYARLVADHFPERASGYRRTLQRLSRLNMARTNRAGRLVHKDLHDGNVVVDGDQIGLLDVEYIGAGDPNDDLSNLAAHLVLQTLQSNMPLQLATQRIDRLSAAYQKEGGLVDAGALAEGVATTLFRLACLCPFRRQSQHLAPDLLLCANEWIPAGASTTRSRSL